MKYWIHLILIVVLGCLLGQWLPWWSVAPIGVISAFLLRTKFWLSGMFGFLAGFILWACVAFYLDVENRHLLSSKLGPLFGGLTGLSLSAIGGLIGGLLASLGSLLGSSLRNPKSALSNK